MVRAILCSARTAGWGAVLLEVNTCIGRGGTLPTVPAPGDVPGADVFLHPLPVQTGTWQEHAVKDNVNDGWSGDLAGRCDGTARVDVAVL